jgi:hypothetical protein
MHGPDIASSYPRFQLCHQIALERAMSLFVLLACVLGIASFRALYRRMHPAVAVKARRTNR